MLKIIGLSIFVCFIALSQSLISIEKTEPQTVSYVDLNKYAGKWYEISRLRPAWKMQCALNVTVTYTLESPATLHVATQCQTNNFFQKIDKAEGTVEVVDKKTQAKLKVTYPFKHPDWLAEGDYWIIQLAEDYSYAVMSNPSGTYVQILSRTPTLDPDLYQIILDRLVLQLPNLNVLNMLKTEQTPDGSKGS